MTSIVARLTSDLDVSALISDGIFPGKTPQAGTTSAILYATDRASRIDTMDGATGMVQAKLRLSCWATSYAVAKSIAHQVRKSLDNFRGTMTHTPSWGGSAQTLTVDAIFLTGESDVTFRIVTESSTDGVKSVDTENFWGVRQDYEVRHRETVDLNTT